MKNSVSYRAIKHLYKNYKKELFFLTFQSISKGLLPLITIFLSARIIDEIGKVDSQNTSIKLWAIYSVLAIFFTQILMSAINYFLEKETNIRYFKEEYILSKKYNELDLKYAEDTEIIGEISHIQQNKNFNNYGITHTLHSYPQLIESLTLLIGSVSMISSFFSRKIYSDRYEFLNNTWLNLGFILSVLLISLSIFYIRKYEMKKWAELIDTFKFANRYFSYFIYTFINQPERALDNRIYNQSEIVRDFDKQGFFGTNSGFNEYLRKVSGVINSLSSLLNRGQMLIIYMFVSYKAFAGAFSVGYLTQYIGSISQFIIGFGMIMNFIVSYIGNLPFAKKVLDYLDIESDMYKGSLTTEKRNDRKYEVEFRNVSFKYPNTDNLVLQNVNLKFELGKRLAIVGKNGSGKSTFIKLLIRFYDPDEGEILLNGINIKKYNYKDYIKIFSVVFQDYNLFSYPIAQNIAGSVDYDEKRVLETLEDVGLREKVLSWEKGLDTSLYKNIDESGIEVSGGESQKIAIARAIYQDAAFIILDEPTAALDPISEAEIYERLAEIVKDRTAIFISHRLSSCKFSDSIIVFDEGNIVQTGKHEDLVKIEGEYKKLWNAQAGYYINN